MLNKKLTPSWELHLTSLQFLIAVLLVLGIFFRFANIDRKVYWLDETFTSIRVSGYTESELVKSFSQPHVTSIEALQKYQRPNPEKSFIDTIRSLELEDPHHPPLYYLMARLWAQVFGNSVTAMRMLPALISILALPCIYWLCLELFDSPLTGWVATALLAVSPFQVLYAQEARQYSLWTLTILLSSAALLRAIRLKTKASWGIYAVTLIMGFYTFLFSVLVAIGHGIYIIAIERFRLTKTLVAYLVASVLAVIAFTPWLWVISNHHEQAHGAPEWVTSLKLPVLNLLSSFTQISDVAFIDLQRSLPGFLISKNLFKISNFIFLFVIGYSLYFICRKTPKRSWLFILTLTGFTLLTLILQDIVLGGYRSLIPRYIIPFYLGVQLAIAYLLAAKLTNIFVNIWQQKLWQLIVVVLVSAGVLSCAIDAQVETPWSKELGKNTPEIARILNQSSSPLLVGSPVIGDLLSLSYKVSSKVKLLVEPRCRTDYCVNFKLDNKPSIPKIPDGFSNVFLINNGSFEKWLCQLKKNPTYKLEPVVTKSKEIILWRIKKRNKPVAGLDFRPRHGHTCPT
jgi:uncharacterized membrane protein